MRWKRIRDGSYETIDGPRYVIHQWTSREWLLYGPWGGGRMHWGPTWAIYHGHRVTECMRVAEIHAVLWEGLE